MDKSTGSVAPLPGASRAVRDPSPGEHTPRELSALSRQTFTEGSRLRRKLQHLRPYICPFDMLLLHVPVGASLLDAGCGSGLFLILLAASGRRIAGQGFDISPEAIALAANAANRLQNSGSSLAFECRTLKNLWPDGLHDVVSMIDVLHHVPPPVQRKFFIDACQRVKPGGVLLYKDMCTRPYWRAGFNRLHDLLLARQWIHHVPHAAVKQWGAELGLTLLHYQRINRWWYGHDLCVFRKP